MADPAILVAHANALRDCARRAQGVADRMRDHLKPLAARGQEDGLWRGAFPSRVASDVGAMSGALNGEANRLDDEASDWLSQASRLEQRAEEIRTQHAQARGQSDEHDPAVQA